MIGSDLLEATATVFLERVPLLLRAAGRAVITLDRIKLPLELWSDKDSTNPVVRLSM